MATIDTLQINIETNAGQSTKSINNLSKAIERLTSNVPGVRAMGFAFDKLAKSINSANVGGLVTNLKLSNSTLKSLSKNAEKAKESLDVIQTGTTSGTTTVTTENAVTQHTRNIKKSAEETKKLTKQTTHSATAFSKLAASVKRIMLYRAIRSLLSGITKAAREGVSNIVEWSKAINDPKIINASQVINKYNNEWLKVKNTLGAILIPVLEGVFGEFKNITTAIVSAGNVLAEYVTLLNDNDAPEFVGINPDYFKEVADNAKKANGQLQKFDELNNLTTNGNDKEEDYNKMFKVYETTRKIDFTWSDIIDNIKKASEFMISLWAIDKVIEWGDEVAKLFAAGGSAAGLGKLATWAEAGLVIGVTLLLDKVIRDNTEFSGIGEIADWFLAGALPWQQDFDKWWDKNINDQIKLFIKAPQKISNNAGVQGAWESLWHILTPQGWFDMLVNEPLRLLDDIKQAVTNYVPEIGFSVFDNFTKKAQTTRENVVTDLKGINSTWGWLANSMDDIRPLAEVDDSDLWYFENAIVSAKARWEELNGLKPQEPWIKTDKVTAFEEAIKDVADRWLELGQMGKLNLDAVLKLTADLGMSVRGTDIPEWLTDFDAFKEKVTAFISTIREDLKSILTSNNPLQGITSFASTFLTRLQDFLRELTNTGNEIVKAIGNRDRRISEPRITKDVSFAAFADGGFPTSGSLFLAGEAGAEMVGSINGRTAVANNAEITTAIATACYNAMSQALQENGMNVTLQGDANGLFKVVQKQARQFRQTTGSYAF